MSRTILVLLLTLPLGAQALFQTNSPAASLTLGGIFGTPIQKALIRALPGDTVVTVVASDRPGHAFDLLIVDRPLRSAAAGALVTGSGQIVNVDHGSPTARWLFGGALFGAAAMPVHLVVPGVAAPLSAGHDYTSSGQLLLLDPASADGARLSQGVEIQTGLSLELPLGDDSGLLIVLSQFAPCVPASIPVLGVPRSHFSVVSNGRILFGGVDTNPVPALPAGGPPFLGAWCDLDPTAGGRVRLVAESPEEISILFEEVPYFGLPGPGASFRIRLNVDGELRIDGVDTIAPAPLGQLLGFFPGAGAAASPGAFYPTEAPIVCTDGSLFRLGTAGTLAPLVHCLRFLPTPAGGYAWIAH
jgi:hypothetical protein